jgi:hypothetical protein
MERVFLQIQINDHINKFHSEQENPNLLMCIYYIFVVYSAMISASSLFKVDGLHIREIWSIC